MRSRLGILLAALLALAATGFAAPQPDIRDSGAAPSVAASIRQDGAAAGPRWSHGSAPARAADILARFAEFDPTDPPDAEIHAATGTLRSLSGRDPAREAASAAAARAVAAYRPTGPPRPSSSPS